MKKLLTIALLCLVSMPVLKAQTRALKTNALYWMAAGTMNLEYEYALSQKTTLSLSGLYNPWSFSEENMMHVAAFQPAFRYWFCERFEGHFVGIHAHGAQYFGNFWDLADKRYDGYLVGAGISWGYDWILSRHWNLEVELGFGINHTWYDKSECLPCFKGTRHLNDTFLSPTKVALSLVYVL